MSEIIGYTYKAENYTPAAIIGALPTGEGGEYEGWALAAGVRMSVEDNLNEIAYHFGIDRSDETSFDSDTFPKVILSTMDADPDTFTDAPWH